MSWTNSVIGTNFTNLPVARSLVRAAKRLEIDIIRTATADERASEECVCACVRERRRTATDYGGREGLLLLPSLARSLVRPSRGLLLSLARCGLCARTVSR